MPENLFKPKRAPTSQPISQPVVPPVAEPAARKAPTSPAAPVAPVVQPVPVAQPVPAARPAPVVRPAQKAAEPIGRVELEEFKFVPANAATPTGQDYELSQEDTKELLTRLRAAYEKTPATYNQQVAPVFIQFSKERGITPADLMAGAARAGSDLQEIRRVAGQEYGDPEFRLTGQAAVGQALTLLQTRNLLPAVKTTREAEQRATIRAKERNTIDMLPEEDRQRKAERATQLSLQAPTFAPASESYAFGSPVASEDPEVAKGEEAARAQAIVEAIPPARRLKYTTGTERLSSDSLTLMKDAAEQIIGAEGVLMVINGEPINFRSTDARSVLDEMRKQGVDLSRYGDEAGQLEAAGRVGNEVLRRAFGRSMNELAALRTVNGITTPVRLRIPYQMLMGISRSGEFDPVKGGPLFKPEDLEMTPEQILDREGLSGLPEAILVATAPQVEIVGFKAGGAPGESQQAVLLRQQSATETWFDRASMMYPLLKRVYTEPPIRITSEGVEMVGLSEYLGEVLGGMQRRESAFEDIANNEKVRAYINFYNRGPDLYRIAGLKPPERYQLDYNGDGKIDDADIEQGWRELKDDSNLWIARGLGLGAEVVSPDLFDVAGPILSAGARGSLRAIRYNPSAVKVLRDEAAALADGDLETAASKARELGYRQGVSQEKAALDAEAVSSGNAPALANAAIVVDSVVAQEMRLAGKADEMFDTALVESLPVVKAEDAGDTLLDVERRKGYLHGSQRGKGDEDAMPTEGRRSRYGYKRALDDLDAMEAAVKRGEGYFPEKIKAATANSLAQAAAINDGAKVAVKAAADLIHRNRMSEAIRVAEAGLKAADIPADDAAKVIAKVKEAADKAVAANKKAMAEAPAAIERARKGVAQQVASRQRAVQELADFAENVEGRGRIGRWMNQNLPAIDRQLARFRQPGSFTSFITRQSLLDAAAAMTVEQKQRRLKGALDGVESARKRKAAAEAAALKATASNDQAKIDAANKAIDAEREKLVKAHEQVAAALTDGRVNGLSAGGYRLLGRLVDAFDDRFNEAELAATAIQYEGRAQKMVEDGLETSAEEWLDKQTFMTAKAVPVGSVDEVLESSVKRPIPPGNREIPVSQSRRGPLMPTKESAVEPRVKRSVTGEVQSASVDLRYRHTISNDIPTMVKEVQDLPWFHGARQGDVQLADYDVRIHSNTRDGNMFGPGLYLAENPEVAISYAASAGQKLGTGTEGKSALKAVAVKPERLLDIRLSSAEKKGLTLGEYVEQQLLAGGVDSRLAGYFAGAVTPAEVGEVLNSLKMTSQRITDEMLDLLDTTGDFKIGLGRTFDEDSQIIGDVRQRVERIDERLKDSAFVLDDEKARLAEERRVLAEFLRLADEQPAVNDFEVIAASFDGLLHTGRKDGNVLVLFDPNDRLKTPLVDGQPPTRGDRAVLKSESRALPEQILYQFAGEEGAKNLAEARKQLNLPGIDERYSLATAKRRILAGENPETVRQQTGWFLGMDDKWRFEIDDSQAAWKGDAVRWLEEGGDSIEAGQDWLVLEDVLDHPTLFEAYPGLRRMPIAFYDFEMAAGFSGKTGGITIGTKAKPGAQRGMESLMHEIQHAIQVQEGFAVGGTPRLTAWAVPAYRPALVEAANRVKNKKPLTIQEYAQQAWGSDKITPEIKADYDWSYLPSFTAPGEAKVREMAAEDVYQRLAGEIEARNTAARKEMTAAERRAKAPNTDKTDVVVVFRGKEMQSEPANVVESGLRQDDAADQLLDQAKAFVRFSADGSAVVALMEKGDFSSLIHETAHIFRRTLSNKDNETVVKWTRSLGFDVSLANGRFIGPDAIKAEEAFARGYERFVREGKSPVKALTLAFEKMRDWMLATYKAVKGSPIDIKLNPDIEAVFANMTTPKAWMDEAKPTVMGEKIAPAMTAQSWLSARLTRAGVNLSADDIERRLAAGETIELPFKVFGKNEINEEDLAKIQSSLDRVSALQETKVDFTVPFDNVQQSVVEPTLVGELQSTMSADPTLRDTQAATRKAGRVIGRAVSAVMTGADALKNERVFSPRLRALGAEGGRILNQRVGDFNVLMRDASRSLNYQHLFDYMTGKDVKFSIGGRKPLSAGHDAVDEASQILQGQHGKLASDISIKTNKVDYGNPEDMPKDGWLGRDGSIVTDESLAAPPAQVVGDTVTLAFDAGAIADRDTRGARLAALFDGPNGRAHMLKTRATAIHMMESSPFLRHLATAVFDISDVDETRTAAEIIGTVAPDRILAYLEAVYKLAGGKIDVIEVGRRGLVFDPDLTSEEKVQAFFDVLTREKFGPVAVNRALSIVNVFGSQKTVYNRVADIGMTFGGEERKAFRNFLNGGFTTPQEYAAGLWMFAEFGFNYDALDEAAKIAGSVKSTRYMPNNVQRQIGRALGRALDESTEVEKKVKGSGGKVPLFIKSAMQAVQSMFVRGRYIPKSAKVWMDLLDTGVMSGAVGGFSLGVESVVRQALQSGFVSVQGHALTKLTTLGTVKTNQVREALQWIADQLVDRATGREFVASVNDTLRGANKVIRMPDGRRYTYSDLLQTAIANGVVASFETSELSENVRKAVEVGLARRFPGLPADAINWTDARKEEWIKANSELFETWAERERIGVMLGLMHRGQTPEQAARLTVKALFDYPGSLADTETKGSWSGLFLSLAQPYWTWQKNINHFLLNAMEEPAVQYRLGVVRRASEWGPEAVSQALYTVMVDPYGFDLDRMSPEERRIYFYLRAAYEESLGKESWQMSEEERLNFAAALWATHFQASETMTDGKLFHLRAEDAREVERRLRGSTAAMTLSEKYVPRPDINSVPDHQRGRIRAVLPFRNTEAMLDYIRNTDQQDLMMSLVFYEPGPIGGYNYLINSFRFVTAPLGILAATVAEQPTIDATLTARYIDGLANLERMPLVSETIVFLQGGSKTRLAGPVAQMFQSSDVADRLLVYRKMEPVSKEWYDRDIANGVDPREAGRRYGQVVYANPLVNLLFGIHPLLYDFNRTARMLETRGAFARDDELANIRKVLLLSGVVSDIGEVSQRKTEERTVYEIPRKTIPR